MDPECEERETADEVAADIEFISLVEETSLDGMVLSMADSHATYINIRTSNCVRHPDCSRKKVKMLIEAEIPDVDFHASKQKNVSQKLSIKGVRDVAMQNKFDSQMNTVAADMKTLFDASIILRTLIKKTESWKFCGSLTDISDSQLPVENIPSSAGYCKRQKIQ